MPSPLRKAASATLELQISVPDGRTEERDPTLNGEPTVWSLRLKAEPPKPPVLPPLPPLAALLVLLAIVAGLWYWFGSRPFPWTGPVSGMPEPTTGARPLVVDPRPLPRQRPRIDKLVEKERELDVSNVRSDVLEVDRVVDAFGQFDPKEKDFPLVLVIGPSGTVHPQDLPETQPDGHFTCQVLFGEEDPSLRGTLFVVIVVVFKSRDDAYSCYQKLELPSIPNNILTKSDKIEVKRR